MANFSDRSQTFCIHEDRETHLVGAQLTILSLLQHCPDVSVVFSCPELPSDFERWLSAFPTVTHVSFPELIEYSWNVKPFLLLRLFERGYTEIIWLDADIIVTADVIGKLTNHDDQVLVVTQDSKWGEKQGSKWRTHAWGLSLKRHLSCTINSGILRVTSAHIPLLHAWQRMLSHPTYVQAQETPWHERPVHMVSDQDALTALMSSQEYASCPIVMLETGRDIAQCKEPSGFTPLERLSRLTTGLPPFVHAIGSKPWANCGIPPQFFKSNLRPHQSLRHYFDYVALELSPYTSAARPYRNDLSEDADWLCVKSRFGKLLMALFRGNPLLVDLPLSIMSAFVRQIRCTMNREWYSDDPNYYLDENPVKSAELTVQPTTKK